MNDEKLAYLKTQRVGDCTRCPLHIGRKRLVFGEGDGAADLMVVGDGPGEAENRRGKPFVGRTRRVVDQWIDFLNLTRDDVYVTNMVKCGPRQEPALGEVAACLPFLRIQIHVVRPKVILALGRVAGGWLTGRAGASMRQLRTADLQYDDEDLRVSAPVVAVYHPAYVLRQGGPGGRAGKAALSDLRFVRELLDAP